MYRMLGSCGVVLMIFVLSPQMVMAGEPAGEWLEWGGPNGDFRLPNSAKLIDNFGDKFPKRVWKRELGDGYSPIVAKAGRLYTQYRLDDLEVIVALDSATGDTIWEQKYPVSYYDNMDLNYGKGPNACPLIMGENLYTVSVSGELRSTALSSGKLLWKVDLHERYGRQVRKEEYGFSASPIAYKGNILLTVGGDKHGLVALNPSDGSQIWGSPASRVSYAQATMIQTGGQDQLVFFSPTEVIGADPENGRFLWRFPVECFTENNLTPVLQLDDRHLWVASQLDGGSRVLKLPGKDWNEKPEAIWETKSIRQAHWNSLVMGDYIYGSFGGNSNSHLAGLNWKTGEFAWRMRGFHLAKGVLADGKFYFLDENGQFVIARFSPKGVNILDAYQLLTRVSWTAPTLVGTRIFMRDRKHILAVELGVE
jgi:hypothetical protein